MLIDAKETLELADMLRLRLSPSEAERFSADMSSVLDYVRLLDELDVAGVDPMGVALGGYAELREDVPGESLPISDLEMLAGGSFDPQTEMFVTKPIFS